MRPRPVRHRWDKLLDAGGDLRPGGLRHDLICWAEDRHPVVRGLEALLPADLVHREQVHALAAPLAPPTLEKFVARGGLGCESDDGLAGAPTLGQTGDDVLVLNEGDGGQPAGLFAQLGL